ncbi:MAG: M24 family metallopeptidase, partial [Clostridiales Family XIII bacterium]|nr:M24 family metallopeptidase [Clostridiales Family XIII bacterium]
MSTVIEGIARITREMGLDAVIVGEGNASRHILQNVDEWDAGLHEAIKLNLNGYTRLSRWDAFFITAGGAYGLSPFMGEGGYDGVISLRGPGEWDSYESLGKALGEIGRSHGVKTCGFTAVDMNAKVYLDIAAHAGFELRELDDDPFAVLRSKHTEREIEKITRAQRIAEEALELLIPKIVPGAVELELRQELIGTMISLGASGPSCRLLGSGKATGESHAQATAKKIEKGDAVVIDFGAIFDDYNSDMTRTFFVGSATDEQKFHYNLVLEAQQAAIDAFKVGAL